MLHYCNPTSRKPACVIFPNYYYLEEFIGLYFVTIAQTNLIDDHLYITHYSPFITILKRYDYRSTHFDRCKKQGYSIQ